MEISNSVIPRVQTPGCFTGGGIDIVRRRLSSSGENRTIPTEFRCRVSNSSGTGRLVRMISGDLCGAYKEKGHLEYYRISPVCGKKVKEKEREKQAAGKSWGKMSIKKRTKLLKGLAVDLSMFADLGFGLDPDETNGKGISQAAEVLIAQLEHLRSEDKKQSKSQKMNMNGDSDSESESSSSSESSDSECEGETVNMSDLKTARFQPALEVETLEPRSDQETVVTSSSNPITVTESPCQARIIGPPRTIEEEVEVVDGISVTESPCQARIIGPPRTIEEEVEVVDGITVTESPCQALIIGPPRTIEEEVEVVDLSTSDVGNLNGLNLNSGVTTRTVSVEMERIQVCMGGKCKKLGAQALVDEFESALGRNGSVVTCKCMGKCKSAPNVKMLYGGKDDEIARDDSVRNPLCLSVGLEDVEFIVANYFGKEALFGSCAPLASSSS